MWRMDCSEWWVNGGDDGEGAGKPGRAMERYNHNPSRRVGWSGPDNTHGNDRDVSFEGSTTLVAATLGHQPAIPIIHRNQFHPMETQIKLVLPADSNGWQA